MLQLDMPVTVDIDLSFSMETAMKMLGEQIGIVPVIDQAVRESGYRTDLLHTHILRADGIKARSVLNTILAPYGLAWVVKDGTLTITTKQNAREAKFVRVYYVGDIVSSNGFGNHEQIMTIITTVIEPDSWWQKDDAYIRDASVDYPHVSQSLTVRQTEAVHSQIENLLDQLRKLNNGIEPLPLPPFGYVAQQQPESERQILRQLDNLIGFDQDYHVPLMNALELLCAQGIPYYFDIREFRRAALDHDPPVEVPRTNGIKVKDLLNTILDPLGLTYVVKHEMLFITSKQAARGQKLVRMHYVGDLLDLRHSSEDGSQEGGIAELVQLVIDPESWKDGDAVIAIHETTRSLAVRQFEDNHARIENLLEQIRQLNDEKQQASSLVPEEQGNQRSLTLRERIRARTAASPNRIFR